MFAGKSSSKPTVEMWDELSENDEDFKEEFKKLFKNLVFKEVDNGFTAD